MKSKKIAVIIDIFAPNGGAFSAAYHSAEKYREVFGDVFFVCGPSNETIENNNKYKVVSLYKKKEIYKFVVENKFDVIHYYKSAKRFNKNNLFRRFINSIDKNKVRVITTVCQQPSNGKTILTPFEIKNSDKVLFIDKTAYNDPLFSFIPYENKDWFYLYNPNITQFKFHHLAKKDYKAKDCIVFGRGSTLNKCPKDTINIYDRIITNKQKKFVIVGVPDQNNWLYNKILKRKSKDILTYPFMKIEDYMNVISSVDIFLYYLPQDIYSSIDGSLLNILRLGIPAVVYGPSAPKEIINHGVNGFVANTKEEFIYYAELLASDDQLREKIGTAAKLSTFSHQDEDYKNKQIKIIEGLFINYERKKIKISIESYIKIYFRKILAEVSYLFQKLTSIKDII